MSSENKMSASGKGEHESVPMDRLRSITWASEFTGLKEVTWRKKLARRECAYVKLGRRTLIRESEIRRIIDEGTVPALEPR